MVLEVMSPSSTAPSTILQRTVGDEGAEVERELRLLFLGCEAKPPYGPYKHTATLFMDLIVRALQEIGAPAYKVIIDVYHVSQNQFPPRTVYGDVDGIILPGSFNAAYDSEPWILELAKIIQEELVAKQRPTLGVCFGHQLYAHSFEAGGAIKCPAGPQAGRKVSELTSHGKRWLNTTNSTGTTKDSSTDDSTDENSGLELFYSHGDMVEKLPPQGISLGGTKEVPVQAAIYFSATNDQKPIAITFQAHPEYASSKSLGLEGTLGPILKAMHDRQDITDEELERAGGDAIKEFEAVEKQSIQTMITTGRILGWFPAA
jgi:GMP synthase-like glutamine amidotransferase